MRQLTPVNANYYITLLFTIIIKKLCDKRPKDWHRYLHSALFAIREMPNDTLKFSPFELLYGRRVRGPLSILPELWTNPKLDEDLRSTYEYVCDVRNRLEEGAQIAAEKYKAYHDLKAQKRSFKIDDEVLILLPTDSNKLLSQWRGPFKIIKKMNNVDYLIQVKNETKIFHANMLKKYHRREANNVLSVFVDELATSE